MKPSSTLFSIRNSFEKAVERNPVGTAMVLEGETYTYEVFSEYVNRSLFLLTRQYENVRTVAVVSDGSVWMHACMMAVFISGRTLLPLHPGFPAERNSGIIRDALPGLIFSATDMPSITAMLSGNEFEIPRVIADLNMGEEIGGGEAYFAVGKETPAYILYTSGSTGSPKGVPVPYRALEHFLCFFCEEKEYGFGEADRFLQVYEPTFDVFYFSFLVAVCSGAGYYTLPGSSRQPKFLQVLQALKEHNITVTSMVPTTLLFAERFLPEITLPSLRYSFFSGDALYHRIAVQWQKACPNAALHNCYGPTETTIVCTRYIWKEADSEKESVNGIVPLGVPFPEMEYEIIQEEDVATDAGGIGELCFTGPQVIEQYMHGLFPEKFYISSHNGKKYYKTGDLAARNEQGNLVFYGRKDFEVKINGYRIDLGEVENAISLFTGTVSMVVVKTNAQQVNSLIAFVEKTVPYSQHEVLQAIAHTLPDYMLPAKLIKLDAFPVNNNQKIDRKALLHFI